MGFVLLFYYFTGAQALYLSILFFVLYILASAPIYFFLSSTEYFCVVPTHMQADVETWADLRRTVNDSYKFSYGVNELHLARAN